MDEDEKLAMQMTRESLSELTKDQREAVLYVQKQSKIDSEK